MATYYEVLGLAIDDPPEKVQARFRLLARDAHPDRGGHEEDFRRYVQAYRTLSDLQRRIQYNAQIGVFAMPRSLHPGYDLYQRVDMPAYLALEGGSVQLTFDRYEPCPRCWLLGCERCQGQGLLLEQVEVRVRIPANMQHGKTVFVEGCGACREPGGPRGDLFVYVYIETPQSRA